MVGNHYVSLWLTLEKLPGYRAESLKMVIALSINSHKKRKTMNIEIG